jgi:hypothetical protein
MVGDNGIDGEASPATTTAVDEEEEEAEDAGGAAAAGSRNDVVLLGGGGAGVLRVALASLLPSSSRLGGGGRGVEPALGESGVDPEDEDTDGREAPIRCTTRKSPKIAASTASGEGKTTREGEVDGCSCSCWL